MIAGSILVFAAVIRLVSGDSVLTLGGADGAIRSLKTADGVERAYPADEAFRLQLLDGKGEAIPLSSRDFSCTAAEDGRFIYRRPDGLTVEMSVKPAEDGAFEFRPAVHGIPKGVLLEWFDGPCLVMPNDVKLYWPCSDGCEVSNFSNREDKASWSDYRPIGWTPRCKSWGSLYPGKCQMQFLAYYKAGRGVYFMAEDPRHTQKGVEYDYIDANSTRLSLQVFCGDLGEDGAWRPDWRIIVRPYSGDWRQACVFYRDWVRTLPGFDHKPPRPAWAWESPVNLIYPVQGEGIDRGPMTTNCYWPFTNAMPHVERYGRLFDSKIMALLMHWEGTAPWCPPYVWPPLGGEKGLAEFRDALHRRGDLLGLYCSGTAWTQRSCINGYSQERKCDEENLRRHMMRGPKGEIDATICNHPQAQRFGFDMCLTEPWTVETHEREIAKIASFGVDYCQYFDQNLGGGALLCYSREHGHPPIPGAWQTAAMLAFQRRMFETIGRCGSGMTLGCEASAATPYVPNLFYNDAREGWATHFGRPVPGISFVFHEWMCNFAGNQCGGATSDPLFRLARSFHYGNMLSVVLGPEGKLAYSWAVEWSRGVPDQEPLIALVRDLNALRKRYPEFLLEGRMAIPFATFDAAEDDVLSSFWESMNGDRIGFVTNAGKEPRRIAVRHDDGSEPVLSLKGWETAAVHPVSAKGRELRRWGDVSGDGERTIGGNLGAFPSDAPRLRLACLVNEMKRDPSKPGHWNFNLKDRDGDIFHIHATEERVQSWIDSPLGARLAFAQAKFPVGGIKYPAVFTADFTPSGVAVSLGKSIALQLQRGFSPVSGSAGFYRMAGTMSDLRAERLPRLAKGEVFDEAMGGAMCWTKYSPSRGILRFLDASGGEVGRIDVGAGGYVRFVGASQSGAPIEFRRRLCEEGTRAGESIHVAFSWRTDGSGRLYVNGLPFAPDMRAGEKSDAMMLGNRMAETVKVETMDSEDVRVVRRPLSNEEVYAAYRSRNPFDFQFADATVPAGRSTKVKIVACPGGTFLKGVPYSGFRPFTGKADLRLSVARIDDSPAGGMAKVLVPVPEMTRTYTSFAVEGEMPLETDAAVLKAGSYRLAVAVDGKYVTYRYFRAVDPVVPPAAAPSDDEWRLGRMLWQKRFDVPTAAEFSEGPLKVGRIGKSGYLEAGETGSLSGNRYGTVIPFAAADMGKPCALDIFWPDDKPRAMAFAMHPETDTRHNIYSRDRLQCGLFAGEAYRNTGKMQRVRYLFYPFTTNYLFEARTLIDGRPAAVALVRLHEIAGEWPVLKVARPAGYRPRRFGYQDEDQTFFHNLNADFNGFNCEKITSETLRYLAYTGQNVFHYPLARYAATLGAMENSLGGGGNGLWPGRTGEMGAVVRDFTSAGVDWIGEVYMGRIGEARFASLMDSRHVQDGWFSLDRNGDGVGRTYGGLVGNIACEAYTETFLDTFMPYIGQLAKCGIRGVRHWFGGNVGSIESGAWNGLGWGYDDWTVARFAEETGVVLPSGCLFGRGRFSERFRFLAEGDAAVRGKWLKWRAGRVTAFVRRYRERMDAVAPGMPLTLVLKRPETPLQSPSAPIDALYAESGVDLDAIGGIGGVSIGLDRSAAARLFRLYRRWKAADEAENYNPDDMLASKIRTLGGGAAAMVCEHNPYFETFRNSLCPERFNTYFQSFDVKPNGRNFLKTFAYDVGVMDALSVTVGDQPLGTLGAEAEAREFAKAFGALPAVPFEDVPGFAARDGVVARRFAAKDGSVYWYLVNMTDAGRAVRAPFSGIVQDLSDGRTGAFARIDLKPYQLRSFLQSGLRKTKGKRQ